MDRKTTVGLVQVNNSFSGQSYFPYSVGLLQAYAEKHLPDMDTCRFLLPVFERIPVAEAVAQLLPADIVAFSLYVWNAELSLRIASELKRQKPGVFILFGGPHVPNRVEGFLRAHPWIDAVVHGEGEKPFAAILGDPENWRSAPSVSYMENGSLFQNPRIERMKNLDEIPSPYLEGTFAPLMEAYPGREWIVVWETNRGCPFGCTYCDWGSNTLAKIGTWDMGRLKRELDWFAEKKIFFVFSADANFGILERDLEIANYCAEVKRRTGFPTRLSVQNTKITTRSALEKSWHVQKALSDGGLNQGVVVSMQSLHLPTLKAIKRDNMKLESFEEIQRRFAESGVLTMSDLILGMPEETYDSFADGAAALIAGGQHNRIQFNNLSILPNAEMGGSAYQARYGIETVISRIVNIHGAKSENDAVPEYQELVIATKTMPRPDWVRARAFSWWAGLLHFDKVFQIPLVLAHALSGTSYRKLIEVFSETLFAPERFPQLAGLQAFFREKARNIQGGGEEFCYAPGWLGIWWPADEYALIGTVTMGRLDAFYEEALRTLSAFLLDEAAVPPEAIRDAARLNRALLKTPFQREDLTVELNWNVWEFHQATVCGQRIPLERGPHRYRIDRTTEQWESWADWYRRAIWWGNKRGAYLYGTMSEEQLAGHF